ncbi:MAG: hypothetical protein R3F55_24355 [Alphaproteobacteria bacterium]
MNTAGSAAYSRFLDSMAIGYDEWHDGTPYDLDALDALTPDERVRIEARLVGRAGRDWRDVEALVRLGTPGAVAAVRAVAAGGDPAMALHAAAALHAAGLMPDIETQIVAALNQPDEDMSLSLPLRLAAECPTAGVIAALQRGARTARDGRGVHFAALLYFIRGRTAEEFDWDRRPMFLRFGPDDPADRAAAYAEMCAELGLDPAG